MRHRVWAALERFEIGRDWPTGKRGARLPEVAGTIHAYGDRFTASKEPEYFAADGPYALCGAHVKVRLPVSFQMEEDDACSKCADLVRQGLTRAPRNSHLAPLPCQAVVRPDLEGLPQVLACVRGEHHEPPHRSTDGSTWDTGPEDLTPGRYSG